MVISKDMLLLLLITHSRNVFRVWQCLKPLQINLEKDLQLTVIMKTISWFKIIKLILTLITTITTTITTITTMNVTIQMKIIKVIFLHEMCQDS